MLNLTTPQRFYQYEFKDDYSAITAVIDLKVITEITLIENKDRKEIMINTINNCQAPRRVSLRESEVAMEVYSKLVSTWTTYKLATEK